jgi:hypothetical protein
MAPISHNHLDGRHRLTPRDYATDPYRFGRDRTVTFQLPSGGDEPSLRVALITHVLLCHWNSNRRKPSASQLCAVFGFSKQTLSKVQAGTRWPGDTVLAALIHAAHNPH